jgi:hypothetical protein
MQYAPTITTIAFLQFLTKIIWRNGKNVVPLQRRILTKPMMKLADKIADWLLDIAKYVVTATMITAFLGSFGEMWKLYVVGGLFVTICFLTAVFIILKSNKEK